jgi:hypothetical protein
MICAGLKVIQLEEAGTNVTVVQTATSAADDIRCDTTDVLRLWSLARSWKCLMMRMTPGVEISEF